MVVFEERVEVVVGLDPVFKVSPTFRVVVRVKPEVAFAPEGDLHGAGKGLEDQKALLRIGFGREGRVGPFVAVVVVSHASLFGREGLPGAGARSRCCCCHGGGKVRVLF